jgi:hypothetical protein
MRVPLDPCGNPLPAAAAATQSQVAPPSLTPAAAARPTAPATPPAPTTAPKTFSDMPAPARQKQPEGWGSSDLKHVDPEAAGAVRTQKPVESGLEPISTPEARPSATDTQAAPQPSVAPLGPAVEPAPPRGSSRDVPAAETSAAPFPAGRGGHTT